MPGFRSSAGEVSRVFVGGNPRNGASVLTKIGRDYRAEPPLEAPSSTTAQCSGEQCFFWQFEWHLWRASEGMA